MNEALRRSFVHVKVADAISFGLKSPEHAAAEFACFAFIRSRFTPNSAIRMPLFRTWRAVAGAMPFSFRTSNAWIIDDLGSGKSYPR
jgi:hypothetical protein